MTYFVPSQPQSIFGVQNFYIVTYLGSLPVLSDDAILLSVDAIFAFFYFKGFYGETYWSDLNFDYINLKLYI